MPITSEDGGPLLQTVSNTSSASTIHDTAYTSLKRSLSRKQEHPRLDSHALNKAASREHEPNGHRLHASHSSMHLQLPHVPLAAETALAALQFLPTPLIVLSSLKTIVLANEAMGRLLGLNTGKEGYNEHYGDPALCGVTETLRGQTLSQIGIDMMQDGVPVWVSWEKFLDNLAAGMGQEAPPPTPASPQSPDGGDITPIAATDSIQAHLHGHTTTERGRSPMRERAPIQDTVVEVVISASQLHTPPHQRNHTRHHKPRSPSVHATCRMIISIWTLANERFFTLTFTASGSHSHTKTTRSHAPPSVARATSTASTRSSLSSHSQSQTSSQTNSAVASPSEGSPGLSAFPPNGAPSKCSVASTFTDFQKVTRMKDAMLDAMEIPIIAMWKDESVVFPNPAARKLLAVNTDPTSESSYDFMSRFVPWTADFERELTEDENPILKLCRTQRAFTKWQIGLINSQTGKKSNYDVVGRPVFDKKTGEFFAGLIAFKDVTEYTEKIASQNAENEQQFQLICDTMPQMLWTTRPDGFHDYFSQRWYDYTGLTPSECRGINWVLPFHPDDLPAAGAKWQHSLATGDEYLVEYRCKRKDGEWRWMLGRALPLKDYKTGKILKWFGTCTDIQDIVDARQASQRARYQLVEVLRHAGMTLWILDVEGRLKFFEGEDKDAMSSDFSPEAYVGRHAFKQFMKPQEYAHFESCTSKILEGESQLEVLEILDGRGRWFRLRLMPQYERGGPRGIVDVKTIVGIVGTSMDVTQQKKKEQENVKLLANETAAKEASKMKSSFLANMSHEIRTPIAGVLGMSELLMDTELDEEQSEFAQNIQRSANSLLTVINDILDFSKIESGRLDIEEVQFSLPVVLKDVSKMLSYAAARKSLEFTSDFNLGNSDDLPLLGDPGRIRQILTNLLTNSIKFTTDGYVKMSARILKDMPDTTTVEFAVEDTGIGIEEEVKKRLFRPFSQADSSTARRFGGTGLGLTISKNLVDLMHGEIWLESRLDHGTTATFRIPFKKPEFTNGTHTQLVEIGALPDRLQSELSLSVDDNTREAKGRRISPPLPHSPRSINSARATRASTQHSPPQEIQRDKYHILVVEDNQVNQQIAIRFIKSLKFSASAVWNGREALEYLLKATDPSLPVAEQALCPIPSLILMDCQMPVLDGYHATHILRHHAPFKNIVALRETPIVAMTASAIQGDRERCEKAGMDDYLAKPVKKPVLEKMILKWIAEDRILKRFTEDTSSKPALSRTGTDHSSNCADFDTIAAEILGSTPIHATSPTMHSKRPGILPHQGSGSTEHQVSREQRRSSMSRNILASQIPGAGTEAEFSMRRAQQEEKAISLRDAKLLAATEGRGDLYTSHPVSSPVGETPLLNHAQVGSPAQTTYAGQDPHEEPDHVMALTEANVEKFNKSSGSPCTVTTKAGTGDDYFTQPIGAYSHKQNGTDQREKPIIAMADIPGPPPDVSSPGVRLVHVSEMPEGTTRLSSKPKEEQHSLRRSNTDQTKVKYTTEDHLTRPGALKAANRNKSDWSNSGSTVKPENSSQGNNSPR